MTFISFHMDVSNLDWWLIIYCSILSPKNQISYVSTPSVISILSILLSSSSHAKLLFEPFCDQLDKLISSTEETALERTEFHALPITSAPSVMWYSQQQESKVCSQKFLAKMMILACCDKIWHSFSVFKPRHE